jgi:hypothetical protein
LPNATLLQLPRSDLELETLYHQLLGDSIIDTPGRLSDACRSRPGSRASSRRGSHADFSDSQAAAGGLGRRSSSSFSLSMSGPAAASLYGDLFRWYDRNKSGALEREELQVSERIIARRNDADTAKLLGFSSDKPDRTRTQQA